MIAINRLFEGEFSDVSTSTPLFDSIYTQLETLIDRFEIQTISFSETEGTETVDLENVNICKVNINDIDNLYHCTIGGDWQVPWCMFFIYGNSNIIPVLTYQHY